MKITVDAVVFAYINKTLNVLLINRTFPPFKDQLALPGGFMEEHENAYESVIRKLKEETNVELNYIEQLYTFTAIDRDPRERILSISYYALINPDNHVLTTNIHASAVQWHPLGSLNLENLAFDHGKIIQWARLRLTNKIKYEPIGFELLPKQFTMTDLYDLYHTVIGCNLDRRNFIKKINNYKLLKETKHKTMGHIGRRGQLFEFNKEKYNKLKISGFTFDV